MKKNGPKPSLIINRSMFSAALQRFPILGVEELAFEILLSMKVTMMR